MKYGLKSARRAPQFSLENLQMIREHGMEVFLKHERQQWTCPNCGKAYSVHDRNCPHCGKRIII